MSENDLAHNSISNIGRRPSWKFSMFYRASSVVHLICFSFSVFFAAVASDFNNPLYEKFGFVDTMFRSNAQDMKNLCTLDEFEFHSTKFGSYHIYIALVIFIAVLHLLEFIVQFALSISFSHFADIPREHYCKPSWKTTIIGFICKMFPATGKVFQLLRIFSMVGLFFMVGIFGVCTYRFSEAEANQIKNCREWSSTCLPNVDGQKVAADDRFRSCQVKPEFFCSFPMSPVIEGEPSRWVSRTMDRNKPGISVIDYDNGRLCDITSREKQKSLKDNPLTVRFLDDEDEFENNVVKYHSLNQYYSGKIQDRKSDSLSTLSSTQKKSTIPSNPSQSVSTKSDSPPPADASNSGPLTPKTPPTFVEVPTNGLPSFVGDESLDVVSENIFTLPKNVEKTLSTQARGRHRRLTEADPPQTSTTAFVSVSSSGSASHHLDSSSFDLGLIHLTTGEEVFEDFHELGMASNGFDEEEEFSILFSGNGNSESGNAQVSATITPRILVTPARCDFMDFPRGSVVDSFIPNYLNPYHRPRCYNPEIRTGLSVEFVDVETATEIPSFDHYSTRPRGFTIRETKSKSVKDAISAGMKAMTDPAAFAAASLSGSPGGVGDIVNGVKGALPSFVELGSSEADESFQHVSSLQRQLRSQAIPPFSPTDSSQDATKNADLSANDKRPSSDFAESLAAALSEAIRKEVQTVMQNSNPSMVKTPSGGLPSMTLNPGDVLNDVPSESDYALTADLEKMISEGSVQRSESKECAAERMNSTPIPHLNRRRENRHLVKVGSVHAFKTCEVAKETVFSLDYPPFTTCPFSEIVAGRTDLKETPNFSANSAILKHQRRARKSYFSKFVSLYAIVGVIIIIALRIVSELILQWVPKESCFKTPGKNGSGRSGSDKVGIFGTLWSILVGSGP
eukprot:GDKJ01014954.1.p1 GENE.GDKJ01014954.1~~GDKJ01014954.1.p1  ORF type:complete len:906 (-),score=171.15 GDKJ01014954.1:129-2846(-)